MDYIAGSTVFTVALMINNNIVESKPIEQSGAAAVIV